VSKIGRKTQALIDRLARMDPARPRQDRAAIERGVTAHLWSLGLRRRRLVWVEDARSGFRYVAGQARTGGRGRAVLKLIDHASGWARLLLIAMGLGLLAFAVSAPLGILGAWLAGDRVGMAMRGHLGPPTVMSVTAGVAVVCSFYSALVLLLARNMRRRHALAGAVEAALRLHEPAWDAATVAVAGDEAEIFVADFWRHVRNSVAFPAHMAALGEVYGPSIRHLTGSRAFPMTEAFEAGLFLYWVEPR
jgi:hypothetical protein